MSERLNANQSTSGALLDFGLIIMVNLIHRVLSYLFRILKDMLFKSIYIQRALITINVVNI